MDKKKGETDKRRRRSMASNLKRWLTTFAFVPFLILAMFSPWEETLTVLLLVCMGMILHEYIKLSSRLGAPAYGRLLYSVSLLYFLLLHLHLQLAAPLLRLRVICAEKELLFSGLDYMSENLLLPGVLMIILVRSLLGGIKGDPFRRAVSTAFGFLYIIFLMGFILRLRFFPQGSLYVFYLFLLTWGGDAGAYYIGSYFGRHKLTSISPRKTWEGVLGMVAVSFAIACFAHALLPLHGFDVWRLGGLVLLLGTGGLCGDLFESLLKRTAGVKDSGSTIPGHGGTLDKVDALIFNGPLFYFYLVLVIL